MKLRVFLVTLITAIAVVPGLASGLYKWVDEHGNVHYTDRRPVQATEDDKVESLQVDDGYGVPRVDTLDPLPAPAGVPSLTLSKFELRLSTSESANVTIGRLFVGGRCDRMVELRWDDGFLDYSVQDLSPHIAEHFRAAGYRYSRSSPGFGQLELEGRIARMRVDACAKDRQSLEARQMDGSVWVRVGWRVRGRFGEVLFDDYSEGAHHGLRRGDQIPVSFGRALEQATNNLLANVRFGQRLASVADFQIPEPADISTSEIIVARLGGGTGRFTDRSADLLASTVTVRTELGHGSGVFIADSVVLTNAHVVGRGGSEVTLVTDRGANVPGSVIAYNEVRDVALIKTRTPGQGVSVSRNQPHPGEELFVIGTPLDVSLSHTVTKGILSAERRIDGLDFYQTDAAINRGNSGGPAFNDHGELIGISVAGLFTRDGAGLNVNYIIPIQSALET